MYIYICIYMCVYTCICIPIRVYICIRTYLYIYTYKYAYVCMYVYVSHIHIFIHFIGQIKIPLLLPNTHQVTIHYRAAKTHRMPHICRSFSAKEPYNEWLFCGKATYKLRHPTGFRHPVPSFSYVYVYICIHVYKYASLNRSSLFFLLLLPSTHPVKIFNAPSRIYLCIYINTYIYIYMYIYTIYVCIYTHTYVLIHFIKQMKSPPPPPKHALNNDLLRFFSIPTTHHQM